jgi:hypothetical protein
MRVDQGIKARFRVVDFNLLCFIERGCFDKPCGFIIAPLTACKTIHKKQPKLSFP